VAVDCLSAMLTSDRYAQRRRVSRRYVSTYDQWTSSTRCKRRPRFYYLSLGACSERISTVHAQGTLAMSAQPRCMSLWPVRTRGCIARWPAGGEVPQSQTCDHAEITTLPARENLSRYTQNRSWLRVMFHLVLPMRPRPHAWTGTLATLLVTSGHMLDLQLLAPSE
jgi:hypothetical protein